MRDDMDLYKQKAEAKLEQLKADAQDMKAKMKSAEASGEMDLNERMMQIDKKINQAQAQLTNQDESDESYWEKFKQGLDNSLNKIQTELKQLGNEMQT